MADRVTQLQEAVNQARLLPNLQTFVYRMSFPQQLGEYYCNSVGVLQANPESQQQGKNLGHHELFVLKLFTLLH